MDIESLFTLDTSPSPLSGSQDLLSLFGLKPLYDKYVRPYPTATALANNKSGTPEMDEGKGKGKASTSGGLTSIGFSMGGVRIGGEVLVKTEAVVGEKAGKRLKLEKSYAHLVEDIPGKLCCIYLGPWPCEQQAASYLALIFLLSNVQVVTPSRKINI